eukprot:TRINITY_DN5291_c0_g1_i1.p1 TRINITY_DN5291_c0_g1~~TRINITY_DN5291_c0_g1_i1.p1  ORF type:complete len:334 (+),score=101.65 TRINITY_DN5291_c0_g1_i1:337-1338(+)
MDTAIVEGEIVMSSSQQHHTCLVGGGVDTGVVPGREYVPTFGGDVCEPVKLMLDPSLALALEQPSPMSANNTNTLLSSLSASSSSSPSSLSSSSSSATAEESAAGGVGALTSSSSSTEAASTVWPVIQFCAFDQRVSPRPSRIRRTRLSRHRYCLSSPALSNPPPSPDHDNSRPSFLELNLGVGELKFDFAASSPSSSSSSAPSLWPSDQNSNDSSTCNGVSTSSTALNGSGNASSFPPSDHSFGLNELSVQFQGIDVHLDFGTTLTSSSSSSTSSSSSSSISSSSPGPIRTRGKVTRHLTRARPCGPYNRRLPGSGCRGAIMDIDIIEPSDL